MTKSWFKIDPETLVIGCMLSNKEGHIVCKPKLTKRDVFKPSRNKYFYLSKKGYNDLMDWDGTYKDIRLQRKNYITLTLYWVLRYSEEFFL